ncbi:hypothetical protein C8039_05885 [Halogeometricum sp. wsp3]|nr:hypothetical protein C8039_05885 [Halogeometricum sp. wsp3]
MATTQSIAEFVEAANYDDFDEKAGRNAAQITRRSLLTEHDGRGLSVLEEPSTMMVVCKQEFSMPPRTTSRWSIG